MTIFNREAQFLTSARYRVLVNGFADGAAFQSLQDAVTSIPKQSVEGLSFEIYDALDRQYVWTRKREKDARSCPEPFSIHVNGHPNGLSFASLKQAIASLSLRPPEGESAVFEYETCVFALGAPRNLELDEAL